MKKIILITILCLTLTGCYSYREINDLAIVSGIEITMDNNNNYQISLEIINPKKMQDAANSNEPDFFIYTSHDKSLQEAFRNVIKESPKKAFGSHVEILIIDESVCKNNLKDILDFFARNPEIRNKFYVLIGKNDNILNTITPLENISSKNIMDSLKANNKYLGISNLVTFYDLLNSYLNPNIEISLPSIEIKGNINLGEQTNNIEKTNPNSDIFISNIAIFKNNKLIGYLNKEESLTYNFIQNNINSTLIRNNYNNNDYIVSEIIDSNTSIKANIKKNEIIITINGRATLSEVNYDIDISRSDNINKINNDLNNNIENMIRDNIYNIINKYNSDIFGFADLYYKTNPKYYNLIKDEWYNKYFKNINIKVKSKINIFEKGNINGDIND